MKTYNEVVDNLEALEKKEATDVSGLDSRVTALEQGGSAPDYYMHEVTLYKASGIYVSLSIINETQDAIDSIDKLKTAIGSDTYNVSGYMEAEHCIAYKVKVSNNDLYFDMVNFTLSGSSITLSTVGKYLYNIASNPTVSDKVHKL